MFFRSPIILSFAISFLAPPGLSHSSKAFVNESEKADNETALFGTDQTKENQSGTDAHGFDPMLDDVFALLGKTEEGENGTTVATIDGIEMEEAEEEQLLLQCADQLGPFVSLLLVPPHYHKWAFGCHFHGNQSEMSSDHHKNNAKGNEEIFWQMSKLCRSTESFRGAISSQPDCHLFVGFVDHLHQFSSNTLITKLSGKTMDGKEAVVRLVCGKEIEKFNVGSDNGQGDDDGRKTNDGEGTFLKTLVVVEKTWLPGCIAVFFDSRALDLQLDNMAKLLWKDGQLKLGTADGTNKWAASKFLCGEEQHKAFYEELSKMKARNEKMVKGILLIENEQSEVRNVLLKKSDEELFCSEKKVVKGFFGRLWDGLFG